MKSLSYKIVILAMFCLGLWLSFGEKSEAYWVYVYNENSYVGYCGTDWQCNAQIHINNPQLHASAYTARVLTPHYPLTFITCFIDSSGNFRKCISSSGGYSTGPNHQGLAETHEMDFIGLFITSDYYIDYSHSGIPTYLEAYLQGRMWVDEAPPGPVCEDPNASNTGGPLPCVYPPGGGEPTPGPSCGQMYQGYTAGCSITGGVPPAVTTRSSASACLDYCNSQGAGACEWYAGTNHCWAYMGTNCYISSAGSENWGAYMCPGSGGGPSAPGQIQIACRGEHDASYQTHCTISPGDSVSVRSSWTNMQRCFGDANSGSWTRFAPPTSDQHIGVYYPPVTTYYMTTCEDVDSTTANPIFYSLATSITVSGFDYSLSNSGNLSITRGDSDEFGDATITKTLIAGATRPVEITVTSPSPLPPGISVSYINRNCSPNCPSIARFIVSPSTAFGTYPITITGTATGGPTRTTSFNLIVRESTSSALGLSCSTPMERAILGQTVPWTATISGSGTPPYTYQWQFTGHSPSSPSPIVTNSSSNTFSILYSTIGNKTASVTVTDALGLSSSVSCSVPGSPENRLRVYFFPIFEEF